MTDDMFENTSSHKEFDRWGRYLLPDPRDEQVKPWTRVSTFARSITDSFALAQWQQRMTAKGMALRPDLVALAATMDVSRDKADMNKLVEQAKDAAGQKIAANTGTAIHAFTEQVDGESLRIDAVPELHRPTVQAYQLQLKAAGLSVVPELIERVVCLPQLSVGGKFDRVLRESSDIHVVGDVKTGKDPSYGALEIAVQLACYAHAVNACGVWDRSKRKWVPAPSVRTDYAIVMHLPAGKGTCALKRVDLVAGWEAAKLCFDVRSKRAVRNLMTDYEGAEPVPSDSPETVSEPRELAGWEDRFRAVRTRQEASALYREARQTFPEGSHVLAHLVAIGLDTLQNVR